MTSSSSSSRWNASRDNNFDFLRFLFASLVIFSHSPIILYNLQDPNLMDRWTQGLISLGPLAVNGFFVISGFLITRSWIGKPDVVSFLRKRILRIYPGFVVAFLISGFLIGKWAAADPAHYYAGLHSARYAAYAFLLRKPVTPPVFPGVPHSYINASLWTIQYEFFCYLLVAGAGIAGLFKKRGAILTCALLAWAIYMWQSLTHASLLGGHDLPLMGNVLYWPRFLTYFLVGASFYLYREYIPYSRSAMLLSGVLAIASLWGPHYLVLPTLGAYALFGAAFANLGKLRSFGRYGDFSYGVYLYAWPIQFALVWKLGTHLSSLTLSLATLTLAWMCAVVSWNSIEKPFLTFKPAPTPPLPEAVAN